MIDVEHKKPKSDYVGQMPKANILILSSTKCWCISTFSLANLKKHTIKLLIKSVVSVFRIHICIGACLYV